MHKFTLTFTDNGELRTISGWADEVRVEGQAVTVFENYQHLRQAMTYFADTLKVESEKEGVDKKPESC